jgi:hypothetical protein
MNSWKSIAVIAANIYMLFVNGEYDLTKLIVKTNSSNLHDVEKVLFGYNFIRYRKVCINSQFV